MVFRPGQLFVGGYQAVVVVYSKLTRVPSLRQGLVLAKDSLPAAGVPGAGSFGYWFGRSFLLSCDPRAHLDNVFDQAVQVVTPEFFGPPRADAFSSDVGVDGEVFQGYVFLTCRPSLQAVDLVGDFDVRWVRIYGAVGQP